MKKLIPFLLLAQSLALPAIAQQALDLTPAAQPAQDFAILANTRAFLQTSMTAVTSAASLKTVVPMSGAIKEVWVQTATATGSIDRNTWFYVSISRKDAAVLQPICQVNMNTAAERGGNAVNGQCDAGATVNEGDALILSVQPLTTLTSIAINFTFRLADR